MIVIILLAIWWVLLGVIAVFYPGRLDSASDLVLCNTVVFSSCLIAGGCSVNSANDRFVRPLPDYKYMARLSAVIITIGVMCQFKTYLILLNGYLDGNSISESREMLFVGQKIGSLDKLIFGWSSAITYNYLLICSIVYMHMYKKNEFLIFFMAYLLLTSSLKGSRAELYQFIMVGILYFLSVSRFDLVAIPKKSIYKFSAGLLVVTSFIFYIGLKRNTVGFFKEFLDYHIVGFVLLSKYLDGVSCNIELPFTYGISIFGGLDYLVGIIGRDLYGNGIQSFSKIVLMCQDTIVPVYSFTSQVIDKEYYSLSGYNAFYTLLNSGYLSFGYYGVALIGAILGYSVRYLAIHSKSMEIFSGFYLVLILGMIYMGVFSSFLETVSFWMILMLLNFKLLVLNVCKPRWRV